jgi:transcriptional regulator with XRE-family HTH domain
LRAIRHQCGLTLGQVEQESHGRLKAVAVGSYERAERAVTVVTLAELARVYGVRFDELLPHDAPPVPPTGSGSRLRIDLQRLAALPEGQAGPLARYATIVRAQRDDYHSTVLTLREQDLRSLAVVYDVAPGDLTQMLTDWKVVALDP